ncbi:MAG: hypothetical protein IKA17_10780 [Clostridia bacterium]|nr:hypothetical protein [Clostridia bacterium]
MKKLSLVLIIIFLMNICTCAHASSNMLVNGNIATENFRVTTINGVTYADAKALSEAFGLSFKSYYYPASATVGNSQKMMCIVPNEPYATVADLTGNASQEYTYHPLSGPGIYDNNSFLVPVRAFAEIFGYYINYNASTKMVELSTYAPVVSYNPPQTQSHVFYYQSQAEFALPNSGSGYCWVCSYAMLISNLKGQRITPNDVARVNETKTSNGAYCYHSEIASAFGVKFVSALPEDSIYYGGRDGVSGGTYIQNPNKDPQITIAALRQALTLHPEGVMVRYASYPHTMVAIGFNDYSIIFNDPGAAHFENVPFEETCVASRGINIEDITFIQAID